MKNNRGGVIVTTLAIITFVVVSAVTAVVSSVFLSQNKNKISTNSLAQTSSCTANTVPPNAPPFPANCNTVISPGQCVQDTLHNNLYPFPNPWIKCGDKNLWYGPCQTKELCERGGANSTQTQNNQTTANNNTTNTSTSACTTNKVPSNEAPYPANCNAVTSVGKCVQDSIPDHQQYYKSSGLTNPWIKCGDGNYWYGPCKDQASCEGTSTATQNTNATNTGGSTTINSGTTESGGAVGASGAAGTGNITTDSCIKNQPCSNIPLLSGKERGTSTNKFSFDSNTGYYYQSSDGCTGTGYSLDLMNKWCDIRDKITGSSGITGATGAIASGTNLRGSLGQPADNGVCYKDSNGVQLYPVFGICTYSGTICRDQKTGGNLKLGGQICTWPCIVALECPPPSICYMDGTLKSHCSYPQMGEALPDINTQQMNNQTAAEQTSSENNSVTTLTDIQIQENITLTNCTGKYRIVNTSLIDNNTGYVYMNIANNSPDHYYWGTTTLSVTLDQLKNKSSSGTANVNIITYLVNEHNDSDQIRLSLGLPIQINLSKPEQVYKSQIAYTCN